VIRDLHLQNVALVLLLIIIITTAPFGSHGQNMLHQLFLLHEHLAETLSKKQIHQKSKILGISLYSKIIIDLLRFSIFVCALHNFLPLWI